MGRSSALGALWVRPGDVFAHAVSVPAQLEAAVETLVQERRHLTDLGPVIGGVHPEGRFFRSCVGAGFGAVTTIQAANLPRWGGFLSFLVAVEAPGSALLDNLKSRLLMAVQQLAAYLPFGCLACEF